jgi:hypothetical protein
MSSWVQVGSNQDIAMKESTCLNAYMFWIGEDCYSIKPSEARAKFSKELWWVYNQVWIRKMILTQDPEGLTAMREEYTKKTGQDWKTAKLNDVKNVLGYCIELYQQGKVLNNGSPLFRAIMINEGVDVSKEPASSVIKKVEGSTNRNQAL